MEWWGWIVVGILLLIGELFAPGGFYIFFFGLGALLVGAVVGLNITSTPWIEWLLFSIFSLAMIFTLRKWLLSKVSPTQQKDDRDSLVGEAVILKQDLSPGETGKCEARGTVWGCVNGGDSPIHAGQRAKVSATEGLTLKVIKS